MDKILIYDSSHPGAVENRCFKQDYKTEGPGHSFTVQLAEQAAARGFNIMTGDVFLKMPNTSGCAFCITEMYSVNTERILQKGAIPIFCLCTESPLIARDFYINIRKLAGRFHFNIQFQGTHERLASTGTRLSTMYYPTDSRTPLEGLPWQSRKFLVLINRNKRMFRSDSISVIEIGYSVLSQLKATWQKLIDPWIRSREIYKDRIEAIYFFSKRNDFHLYGHGWEKRIAGFSKKYHVAAKQAFKGTIKPNEKLKVMSHYKFVLCFENCVFPGYVTEKIFDCFLASCIPIYFGAPDIENFVPTGTFIDFRKFKSFSDLEYYLSSFSEHQATAMLRAVSDFLSSNNFDKYYTPNIVDGILDKIELFAANK